MTCSICSIVLQLSICKCAGHNKRTCQSAVEVKKVELVVIPRVSNSKSSCTELEIALLCFVKGIPLELQNLITRLVFSNHLPINFAVVGIERRSNPIYQIKNGLLSCAMKWVDGNGDDRCRFSSIDLGRQNSFSGQFYTSDVTRAGKMTRMKGTEQEKMELSYYHTLKCLDPMELNPRESYRPSRITCYNGGFHPHETNRPFTGLCINPKTNSWNQCARYEYALAHGILARLTGSDQFSRQKLEFHIPR